MSRSSSVAPDRLGTSYTNYCAASLPPADERPIAMPSLLLRRTTLSLLAVATLLSAARHAAAADRTVSLSDGKILLTAPETWERKKPATRVIDYEFAIPKVGDDERDGRATISGAGGSVEA
ncbi:MAG TPA: hypothetical protein VMF30_12915, partial [Pirellulales bacterium]|nr:hypothetical protein [Pirellulales bacterium]